MKIKLSKTAYTLMELIVSLALVSVIALGIVSINMVLNNNNEDYGQRYLVKSQTQTTLNHILNNASLAVGSGLTNDEGILMGTAQLGNANTVCIHQAGTKTPGGSNLIGSTHDIWLCYSWINTVPNPYQIEWCAETYGGPGADPRGASSCASSGSLIANPSTGTTTTFLGTAFSILHPAPTFTAASGFSITIQNCLNDSTTDTTACSTTGTSGDMVSNPEVQLTGNVFPPQEGTG